jgi:hypothetical protein
MKPSAAESSQTLKEFKEIMDKLEIPFCLFLGTALGAYRDGTYCPGDEDDMDVAVDIKYVNRIDEIKKEFEYIGWRVPHGYIATDGICPEYPVIKHHDKNDDNYYSKVDIFFINEIDGKMAWRFYLDNTGENNQTKYFDKKHWSNWNKVIFFGEEYNIPGNIEEYLKSNYGSNWKTPIHRNDWNWSKDNKCLEKGLVSIIIPVWGRYEIYLNECLGSIKEQTYKNYEIIIVDNKTDLPSARNEGIKKSKGEYVLCLDVDDKILPTFLEKMVGVGDIVTCHHMDQDGVIGYVNENFSIDAFMEGNRIISGSLFKREIWDNIGGYDEDMKDGYEDWDYNIRAVKAGYKVEMINEPLYIYRKHDDSMIRNVNDNKLREYVYAKHKR